MHQQQIEDYDEDRGKIGRAIQKFNIKSKLLFIGKYEESNSYAYVQGWFEANPFYLWITTAKFFAAKITVR